jgi:hypothetical protein
MQLYPSRESEPELTKCRVRFTGAGAGNPTKNLGQGIAITWISTGLYELTWAETAGIFAFFGDLAFQATTAADLKGYSCVAGDYNATTRKLRVSITNGSATLADLTSTQKVSFVVGFKGVSA